MKKVFGLMGALVALAVLLIVTGTLYTVREDEQIILTQFGKPVGEPVTDAGIHLKMPFVQKVNVFDKRVLSWDGPSSRMTTRDKTYIQVDTFARWKIDKPLDFFRTLRDERSAQSRLSDILGSEMRNAVAKHDLIEIVRSTKDRVPEEREELSEVDAAAEKLKEERAGRDEDGFSAIEVGRPAIEKGVFEAAKVKLEAFGIELLDVRFKRINYNRDVEQQIFGRMISERQQIAELFRSEGAGQAARIEGDMEREVAEIKSRAYKEVQSILGEADAESTRIYAEAYGGTPERESFYEFVKTLEAYDEILDQNTTMILSTDSELFQLLKGKSPKSEK